MPQLTDKEYRERAAYLIDQYRNMVAERYIYDNIESDENLSELLTRDVIEKLKNYFLNHVYPPAQERDRLEEAFLGLRAYMGQPAKIWRLLGNMTSAIFKFGKHFPLALKAGFTALQSYTEAKGFEKMLVKASVEKDLNPPLKKEEFMRCMAAVDRADAEDFLKVVHSLFKSLQNTVLLQKTVEILDGVIEKMKQYPAVYPEDEIEGIILGRDIIENGKQVFSSYSDETKRALVAFVLDHEMRFLDRVYQYAD